MKAHRTIAILLAAGSAVWSQSVPAGTTGAASLRYSVRYAETGSLGAGLENAHSISPSAALAYTNRNPRFPYSLDYSGGYAATLSGPSYATGAYQNLFMSQGVKNRKWNLVLSDALGYRPQSPTVGFSGMPGIGEPIGAAPVAPSSQSILTLNTHALENLSGARIEATTNRRVAINADGSYDLLHYPDQNGFDTRSAVAGTGATLRLDARDSLPFHYEFSQFTYPGYKFDMATHTVTLGFDRAWRRWLRGGVVAGPQWVRSSTATIVPNSLGLSMQAQVEHHLRKVASGLTYSRGTSGGSGYMIGASTDTVAGRMSRGSDRGFTFELSGGYSHNSALALKRDISSEFGGVQASWRIGRYLNAFANYTVTAQQSNAFLPSNVQNGIVHVIGCGFAFTRETHPTR